MSMWEYLAQLQGKCSRCGEAATGIYREKDSEMYFCVDCQAKEIAEEERSGFD